MKRMNVKEGSKALDVCTGTGDWAIALAKAVGTHGEVIGLDFSQNMLKIAQDKQEQQALKRLTLIQGNAMELPFEDDSFDYVTIGFGLRNVPDYSTVFAGDVSSNEARRTSRLSRNIPTHINRL